MKKLITLFLSAVLCFAAKAQSTGDYRSVKSGNWNDISVWQRYNGTAWRTATAYPVSTDGVISISDGNNVTLNISVTIDQTVVDAGGQLSLSNNVTLTVTNGADDDLTVNGLLYQSTGSITGTGRVILNNQMLWYGGALQTKTSNTGTIQIDAYASLYGQLSNAGTINLVRGRIYFYGGSISNNGEFNDYSSDYFISSTGGGIFTNNGSGVFNVNCSGYIPCQIDFTNNGTMNFNSGNFGIDGSFTNSKTLNFNGGAFQNNHVTNFNRGTKITGNGNIQAYSNALSINTPVTVPQGIIFQIGVGGGANINGSGSINLSGQLLWYGNSLSVPVNVQNTGYMHIGYASDVYLNSPITNSGVIDWVFGNIRIYGGSITNNKTFNIMGDYQLINGSTSSFTNNAAGTVLKNSFGTTTVGISFINKGTIGGSGTFNFGTNLANTGTFDPGVGSGTSILHTGTDYTNNNLNIKIKGSGAGIDYDRIAVNGNATLKGSLTVTAVGSVPAGADTILTTTGTITGRFKTVDLPAGYTITYKPNKVYINVPAALTKNEENLNAAIKSEQKLSVFPNPATTSVNVQFASLDKLSNVKITGANGNTVYEGKISSGDNINVSHFTPGIYFLEISKDGEKQTVQFVKQ